MAGAQHSNIFPLLQSNSLIPPPWIFDYKGGGPQYIGDSLSPPPPTTGPPLEVILSISLSTSQSLFSSSAHYLYLSTLQSLIPLLRQLILSIFLPLNLSISSSSQSLFLCLILNLSYLLQLHLSYNFKVSISSAHSLISFYCLISHPLSSAYSLYLSFYCLIFHLFLAQSLKFFLAQSLIYSSAQSLIFSLAQSLISSSAESLIFSLAQSLIYSSAQSLISS